MKATYSHYLNVARRLYRGNKSLRKGQVYYSVLHDIRPDLAAAVNGTERDPFYDDSRLLTFLTFVMEKW